MAKFEIDEDLIRRLAKLIEETGLSEIELAEGDQRVRVARQIAAAPTQITAPLGPPVAAQIEARGNEAPAEPAHPGTVFSPMVGTIYLQPKPGAPPFVTVGDEVSEGQTLLIVEAMKVMNPIPAPRSGTVLAILVQDQQPVEYGEALMIIE